MNIKENKMNININKSSSIPLYAQVEKKLRTLIKSGEIDNLQKPLTEKYLENLFDVSRNTIRRAIAGLAEDGLLISRRSSGIKLLKDASNVLGEKNVGLSFTENAMKRNQVPSAKLLEAKVIIPSKKISDLLNIGKKEEVFYCRRVRYVNGQPACIVNFYVPLKVAPGISADDFSETGPNQSIHYILENFYDIQISKSIESVKAIDISKKDGNILKLPEGSAVLFRKDVIYSTLSEIVGYDELTMTKDYEITGRIIKKRLKKY